MSRFLPGCRSVVLLVALLLGAAALTPVATASEAATARAISISATPKAAAIRSVVTFSGTLTRSPLRSPVQLQRKFGTRWVKVSSTSTRRGGAYRVSTVLPSTVGTYAYRTFAPAKGTLRAATSTVVRVAALRKVTVSAKATPSTVAAGSAARISGTVRPYVAGTKVVIQKQVGASWTGVAITTVTRTGAFAKSIVTTAATTYRAAVARAGKNAPGFSIGVRVDTTPVIATTALPDATRKQPYSFKVTAVGNPSGTWGATGLPTGLTMATNGSIAGLTEVAAGDYPVTLTFTRLGGAVAPAKYLTLRVLPALPPVISSSPLPDAALGDTYAGEVHAIGNPAGTWTATGLPAGLDLDPSTGAITGSPEPSSLGAHDVTFGFDPDEPGVGNATPKTFTVVVAPPTIKTSTISKPVALTAYSAQIELSGSVAVPGTWQLDGDPSASGYGINSSGKITSNLLVVSVPNSFTVTFTIAGAPEGTPPLTRTYTFS